MMTDVVHNTVQSIIAAESVGNGRLAARVAIRFIELSIRDHDFIPIDNLAKHAMLSELSDRTNMAILRSSFRIKDRLSSWVALLIHTKDSILRHGGDPFDLLVGLLRHIPNK